MMVGYAFDAVLALLVTVVAVWTVAARGTVAAVIGFVAYGLLLALVWVRLWAVDVALTEAAIGSGVTGLFLLKSAFRLQPTEAAATAERPGVAMRVAIGVLCAAVSAGLAVVVLFPSGPAPTLAPEAVAKMSALGVGNPVTAVLMAYRALDTLAEKVVLLLAVIGVWSLAPDLAWGRGPASWRRPPEQTGALTFLGQVLPPVGMVIGVYLVWAAADRPGGAFQGGATLAAMWILAMMAGLQNPPAIKARWLRLSLVAGSVAFLAVGLAGFFIADGFLAYPPGLAKPLILLIEAMLTFSIAVTLGMLVAGPPEGPRRP